MSGLTRYEMETIINFNEGEDTASVYTHNKSLRRKLEKLAQERPKDCRLFKVSHRDQAVEYYIPKGWIRIYPPRQISDEQREAMAERLKTANPQRKSPTAQGESAHEPSREGNYTPGTTDAEKEE